MLSKNEILKKLEELKPELNKTYSVSKIGLFGSFSKGSSTVESDIDIIVELENPIGWKFFSLQIYLEQIFDRKVDLVRQESLKEQIKDNILSQVNYV